MKNFKITVEVKINVAHIIYAIAFLFAILHK
jgi:hypothetical protein